MKKMIVLLLASTMLLGGCSEIKKAGKDAVIGIKTGTAIVYPETRQYLGDIDDLMDEISINGISIKEIILEESEIKENVISENIVK